MVKQVVLTLALVACSGDLQDKVDKLTKDVDTLKQERRDLEKRVDQLIDASHDRATDRKIDDLAHKIDQLTARPTPPTRPARREPDRAKTYAIGLGDSPSDGPADAKVTMVEGYDYACPFCEKARDTLVELRRRYGNSLRIVYRPFIVHPQVATAAAYAACAAAKQHKFAQMDHLLWDKGFKNRQFDQASCTQSPDSCTVIMGFARDVGLDLHRFKTDMIACEASITVGYQEMQALGVGATPSFFINGRFTSGAQPVENFAALIDEELAKANQRIQQGTSQSRYYQEWVLDRGEKKLDP